MHDNYKSWLRAQSAKRGVPIVSSAQPGFLYKRISIRVPRLGNGADLSFCCFTDESPAVFWCKEDKDNRPIRATEWFLTQLAMHLGILTPECAILEDVQTGETAFGSVHVQSPVGKFEARKFLSTPKVGEFGQPSEWPGAYLSGLYALDMFVGNPDRGLNNFFVVQDGLNPRILAYDFASARLLGLGARQFPIESDATVRVGRFLRKTHRFYPAAAMEMIDRLAAVPSDTIAAILRPMPPDWMDAEQKERICELWSERQFGGRLLALRSGLADESLL